MTINYKIIETPLGQMYSCATEKGVCLLEFIDNKTPEQVVGKLGKILKAEIKEGESNLLADLDSELTEYFEKKRKEFTIPLYTPGSEFQQLVWNGLLEIPFGKTISYMEQARTLKKPEAIRAIAHANGLNRVAIVIPCHRVIGSDGKLTGYGGGLWRKKWLLDHERGSDRSLWKME
jgi:AraC family transcriptional regulator, regulatory protein of adaptative response / methylated-DNA-[protein]-cysteine methyltransferase